jgi:hypothetical protein
MGRLDEDYAARLWEDREPPCLSLYQPTHRHHPDNRQDPIRFKNLVKQLEESLREQSPDNEIRALLEPLAALGDDREHWRHAADGLAVLRSRDLFRVYKLQRPVAELVVVADSFHVKPLLRIVQSADRYQVLGLSRKEMRLFEGNRDALDEIEPGEGVPRTITEALGGELTEPHQTVASYGGVGGGQLPMHHGHGSKEAEVDIDSERFFRAVDRAVLERHSRPSGLPLILAALPEHHALFHQVSHNPFLVLESIDVHPDALALVEEFGSARSEGRGADEPSTVAAAVVGGRVATLLVEAGRELPGRIDPASGAIEQGDLARPDVDDVLDDLAALTVQRGGSVVIVPSERMPTRTGVAAIYRY